MMTTIEQHACYKILLDGKKKEKVQNEFED